MSDDLGQALQKAASDVFAELTFMLPNGDPGDVHKNASFEMASSVEFWGPVSGRLVVSIYGKLVLNIAANMLGDTASPTEFEQRDALKELVNIICGNMLPKLIGEEAVYKIDAPSIFETMDSPGISRAQRVAQFEIALEAGKADIQLFLYRDQTAESES